MRAIGKLTGIIIIRAGATANLVGMPVLLLLIRVHVLLLLLELTREEGRGWSRSNVQLLYTVEYRECGVKEWEAAVARSSTPSSAASGYFLTISSGREMLPRRRWRTVG